MPAGSSCRKPAAPWSGSAPCGSWAEHPLIAYNPAKAARLPRAVRPKAREWTPERAAAFWEAYRAPVKELTITRHKLDVYLSMAMRPYPVMVWTPAQTGAFLDSVADDRLYAMWHLLAFTGLRRGEVAGCGGPTLTLTAQSCMSRLS